MLFQKQTLTTYCIVRKHNFFLSLSGITSTVRTCDPWLGFLCSFVYTYIEPPYQGSGLK